MSKDNDNIFIDIEGQYDYEFGNKMWYRTCLDIDEIGKSDIPESEINKTMLYVDKFVKENELDGLIGFSQGGNVVDTYLRTSNKNCQIKYAIIFNGYTFPLYWELEPVVKFAELVFGKDDEIVPPRTLCRNYKFAYINVNEIGHKIITCKPFIRDIFDRFSWCNMN